jgi:hypothetical protein
MAITFLNLKFGNEKFLNKKENNLSIVLWIKLVKINSDKIIQSIRKNNIIIGYSDKLKTDIVPSISPTHIDIICALKEAKAVSLFLYSYFPEMYDDLPIIIHSFPGMYFVSTKDPELIKALINFTLMKPDCLSVINHAYESNRKPSKRKIKLNTNKV